jgi:ParB family chromosome partitioning protein
MSEAISQKRSRAETVKQTHRDLKDQLLKAGAEYQLVEEKAARFQEVKEFFENLQGSAPHPGVNIAEIDLSQNDRDVDIDSDEFLALKESIKENGLLQRPVLTLGLSSDKPFLCIAGHRRILAYAELGFSTVPAELIFTSSEQEVRIARLSENLIRQNLQPIELAEAVFRIKLDLKEGNTGLARILNRDRQYVIELLKIAQWPEDVKTLIKLHRLKIGDLGRIAKRKLTNEEVRELVEALVSRSPNPEKASDRHGASSVKYVEKRNSYFEEKGIPAEVRDFIVQFLRDNNIRGWY